MAVNPIQRRSRQSFLIGFLIAVVIMAVVVVLLYMKVNELNEQVETTKQEVPPEIIVYVANREIKSGDKITANMLGEKKVKTNTDLSLYLTPAEFEYDEEGNPIEYTAKVDIPTDSLLISSMLVKTGNERRSDERIIEYNSIILPTHLVTGSYIDIRFMLPSGKDYIVLSKKYVEEASATSIWLRMTEEEMLTMNSVLIDSYITTGTKLYATLYTEPGIQEATTPTYPVSGDILAIIASNPNIIDDAKHALARRWNQDNDGDGNADYIADRNQINNVTPSSTEEKKNLVAGGISSEVGNISSSRVSYVATLEGTGLISSYGGGGDYEDEEY